jgi:methylase of polypeptide subunit release factors
MQLKEKMKISYVEKLLQIRAVLANSQEFARDSYRAIKSGIDIQIFRNVFSPAYFSDSEYFANHLPNVAGLRVLEIGTGTGLLAMKFAYGKAKSVTATDINLDAIRNAEHNVAFNDLDSTVVVRHGHIFPTRTGREI